MDVLRGQAQSQKSLTPTPTSVSAHDAFGAQSLCLRTSTVQQIVPRVAEGGWLVSSCFPWRCWLAACWLKTLSLVHRLRHMGRLFLEPLDGRVYSCGCCGAHLAKVDDLVSKVQFVVNLPCRNFPESRAAADSCTLTSLLRLTKCA